MKNLLTILLPLILTACYSHDDVEDIKNIIDNIDPEPIGQVIENKVEIIENDEYEIIETVEDDPIEFPEIAGSYEFSISPSSTRCADGSDETDEGSTFNLSITQNGNRIIANGFDHSMQFSSITIMKETDLEGLIEENGDFYLNKMIIISMEGSEGYHKILFNMSGSFGGSGINGEYKSRMTSSYRELNCFYESTFDGMVI